MFIFIINSFVVRKIIELELSFFLFLNYDGKLKEL